jgi:hypothetical protein
VTPSRRGLLFPFLFVALTAAVASLTAALVVPNEIQQPGTQPREVSNLETPDKCDNCHGGYNQVVEPAFNWRGSMMANATRDPVFWATLAVAEQDFAGSGDLCIRCHSTSGWLAGRSTPTDGSGLAAGDADGVECDACHKMTNPNNTEHLGVMNAPFIANDGQTPATGYYGTGMMSVWGGSEKLGPYSDAAARHQFLQSRFHRDVDYCGTCHDVSNPAVGDLAHNNGRQPTSDPVLASGVPGAPLTSKAAFRNFPYQYGIVERTFSEYKSGAFPKTLVSNYASLPADLRTGAVRAAFDSAQGNYADGTARYFSCQTCHLPARTGLGCNKSGVPVRTDLPLHDMTGGNYWTPDAMLYQNTLETLRLGGSLTTTQINAIRAGKDRAIQQLKLAASLSVAGNTLKVTNLTGHKLISGYPEGRRMWINVKWYGVGGALLREDGRYDVVASLNGTPVKSIVNLSDPNTRIYETHYGMTQEWANQLLSLGYPATLPLDFDRVTGAVSHTLGNLAAQAPGTSHETFHFVLNNTVVKDNRLPPYGMQYDDARRRNTLPVPAAQYGSPSAGGTYNYWDEVALQPPAGAASADIRLLYQPTSWEYIQFLYLANTGQDAFLANEGINLFDAWLNTGMAEPYVMATAAWSGVPSPSLTVASVAPQFGPVGGGTVVSVTGTGFVAGGTSVTFGGNAATSVDVVSATSLTAVVPPGAAGPADVVVAAAGGSATLAAGFTYLVVAPAARPTRDFDGDGMADVAVYRPSAGTWFSLDSSTDNATFTDRGWGVDAEGDIPVPGDYDGDGVVDPAVFRPTSGTWFILTSSSNYTDWTWFGWGEATDVLVPGDYDGDGATDAAVFRLSSGTWYVRPSNGATPWSAAFGQAGDEPIAGDFDGDGKRDPAVYRAAAGTWFWLKSSSGFTGYDYRGWGAAGGGDLPAPGDYDGDGKTDFCVFQPASGTWFILESHAGYTTWSWFGWGTAGDVLVPADYDGDGRTDAAMYRPSSGTWYVRPSSGAAPWNIVFGQTGDVPLIGTR